MAPHRFFSAQMVRELPDDGYRYETVRGELLVTPAPRGLHQRVLLQLLLDAGNYLRRFLACGEMLLSPADISWSPDTLVQPDLFVVAPDEAGAEWDKIRTLVLVIEVLSPSTAAYDRVIKRHLYQQQRIPHYWIVDCDTRHVETWTPDATAAVIERERLTWHPQGAAEPLHIDVPALFAPQRQ